MTPRHDARSGRLTRRQVVAGAAGLGLAAPFLGSGMSALAAPARQDATPKPGGILKVGVQADPTALDPHKQSLTAIWHVIEQIYDGLTRINPRSLRRAGVWPRAGRSPTTASATRSICARGSPSTTARRSRRAT